MKKKVMYKVLSAAMIGSTILTAPMASMVAHAEEIDIHVVESYQPTAEELAAAEAAAREQGSTMVVVDTPLDDPDVRAAMEYNRIMAERQDAEFAANQKNNEPAQTSNQATAPSVEQNQSATSTQSVSTTPTQDQNGAVPNVAESKISTKSTKDGKPANDTKKETPKSDSKDDSKKDALEKEDEKATGKDVENVTSNDTAETKTDVAETSPKKDDTKKVGPIVRVFYNIGDGASAIASAVATAIDNAWDSLMDFFGFNK